MANNLIVKLIERIGDTDEERLKKSNQIASGIMLINTLSQIYLKIKKDAQFQFPVYYDKISGYNKEEITELLNNLTLTDSNKLQYNLGTQQIDFKPLNSNCGCEPMFTNILSGSYSCKSKFSNVNVANTMILFSGITLLSHVLISTILFKKYLIWIKKDKTNFLRWIEYFFTSSIMITSIVGLTGIMNLEEIAPLIILTGVTNMFGLAIESIKSNKPKYMNVKKILFVSGFLTQGYPWFRILQSFRKRIQEQNKFFDITEEILNDNPEEILNETQHSELEVVLRKDIKNFRGIQNIITSSTLSLFISYFIFPYIMYKQYFKGIVTSKKYCRGEIEYIAASIISKTSLAWQIFGGAFREN